MKARTTPTIVVAEIAHVSGDAAVIYFGLRAVWRTELLPANGKQGEYVMGEIGLAFPLCMAVLPADIIASMNHDWLVN
jgi:hypothetical protein